ncbi:hypothetical protein AA106555_0164 [Neokomagataea thailandica NBRC 106555]|uniref:Transmembrane protein n=2 Tax=Neokomagataea TaxID=1223423 RepID=A0ABQ0QMC0_9PROT|nr:hypothetical protein AA106555_0164 [Neokomagataea thailandica NBRC 106555]
MYQRFDDVLDGAEPMVADEALMLPEDKPRRESLFAESPAQENEPKRGPVFHIASETPWEGLVRNVPVEKKPLGSKRLWMAAWAGSFLCVIGLGGLAWHEYHSTVQQALHNMQHKA